MPMDSERQTPGPLWGEYCAWPSRQVQPGNRAKHGKPFVGGGKMLAPNPFTLSGSQPTVQPELVLWMDCLKASNRCPPLREGGGMPKGSERQTSGPRWGEYCAWPSRKAPPGNRASRGNPSVEGPSRCLPQRHPALLPRRHFPFAPKTHPLLIPFAGRHPPLGGGKKNACAHSIHVLLLSTHGPTALPRMYPCIFGNRSLPILHSPSPILHSPILHCAFSIVH